ncbi:FAA hydrolase family protein [Mycetocola lacteus]|uniref:FAA hydrolase family protein n=1 Tax=Mycetocola lacteus TaxID=76637 RepID=A0A3L7AS69_9MICO|nr:fumarylacetoacetate hydrolase family protein [Mycetocola lacteus]RLP82252.1 FAA hydrolase family protein [Mycetocola lacteus]
MRFATVGLGDRLTGAVVQGERVLTVSASSAVEAYSHRDALEYTGELDAATAHFARVSPEPAHIICVGLNYRSHIRELGLAVPEYPTVFAKFASTLTGPRDRIVLPEGSDQVEQEVELAVVLGRRARRLDVDQASAAIAGYAVANDLSMRDWQHRTSEALQGKVADRTTPLGPYLVTPDEVDNARALRLRATVDGELWQEGGTEDLLFSPEQLVSYCSRFVALEPGDVILTGTPGLRPGMSGRLAAGMTLASTIDGLGSAINPLVAESAGA